MFSKQKPWQGLPALPFHQTDSYVFFKTQLKCHLLSEAFPFFLGWVMLELWPLRPHPSFCCSTGHSLWWISIYLSALEDGLSLMIPAPRVPSTGPGSEWVTRKVGDALKELVACTGGAEFCVLFPTRLTTRKALSPHETPVNMQWVLPCRPGHIFFLAPSWGLFIMTSSPWLSRWPWTSLLTYLGLLPFPSPPFPFSPLPSALLFSPLSASPPLPSPQRLGFSDHRPFLTKSCQATRGAGGLMAVLPGLPGPGL